MADTTFTDNVTVVTAEWLNEVNNVVHTILGDPTDAAAIRTVLNVEDGATADQTGAEIKSLYEAEADTNAYTDAAKTKVDYLTVTGAVDLDANDSKLSGIESGAQVNQNAFSNIAVATQNTVVADSETDTLTLVAGTNITLTTDDTLDRITINAQVGTDADTLDGFDSSQASAADTVAVRNASKYLYATTPSGISTDEILVNRNYINNVLLGANQTWQDVTGSRSGGTNYQNQSGAPILVVITGAGSNQTAVISYCGPNTGAYVEVGRFNGSNASGDAAPCSFVVPVNWYYKAVVGASMSINHWAELRI